MPNNASHEYNEDPGIASYGFKAEGSCMVDVCRVEENRNLCAKSQGYIKNSAKG